MQVEEAERSFKSLCASFGISRKTGYKWWGRFCEQGLEGLRERRSRPRTSPHKSARKWGQRAVELRMRYPWWGAKKIRAKLKARHGQEHLPAASTIGAMLSAAGLVRSRRGRKKSGPQIERPALSQASAANQVWAVDFKGWFRTGDGRRCDPLTVSDLFSRYILCCRALCAQSTERAKAVFKGLFKQYGLPQRIRVDNGAPFGSRGAGGLSRLSVWWLRLGMEVEFIAPGHPEQNGSHERMHRTLKAESAQPPARSARKQQRRFDQWRRHFNMERPHEALGQQVPARRYERSSRVYSGVEPQPQYPSGYAVRRVRSNGQIKWKGRLRFVGEAFVGQRVGLRESEPGRAEVYFMQRLLGTLHEAEADFGGLRPTAYALQNQREKEKKV